MLEKSIWNLSPDDFVHVVHVGGNHWACLSNIFSKPGSVDLYNSLHIIPSKEGSIVQPACTILKYSGELLTSLISNFKLGFDDCGFFAVAIFKHKQCRLVPCVIYCVCTLCTETVATQEALMDPLSRRAGRPKSEFKF